MQKYILSIKRYLELLYSSNIVYSHENLKVMFLFWLGSLLFRALAYQSRRWLYTSAPATRTTQKKCFR